MIGLGFEIYTTEGRGDFIFIEARAHYNLSLSYIFTKLLAC